MAFKVVQANIENAEDITRLRVEGMEHEPLWRASMGNASYAGPNEIYRRGRTTQTWTWEGDGGKSNLEGGR